MRGAEVGQQPEDVVGAGRVHAADPQLAAQQAGDLLELAVHVVHLGQHALRVAEDHQALGRQLDAAARAPEHLDPELLLQPADLLGDGRLAQVQLLAGLGQRAVLGDGDDRAEVTQLHPSMVPAGRQKSK